MPLDIEVRDVTKTYRTKDMVAGGPWWKRPLKKWFSPRGTFTALNHVSFAVEHGEALGIIGHNGAGKSTMLKLLSRITAPTSGEIELTGSLSALIEVSSGFHPDLTGRENVYLNGAIFGMTRKEIARKMNSIVEFSGIGTFIDVPVKRYSSGMYLRLAFSIAAHLEPDILLLDEVLAVGDFAFQRKCLARVDQLKHDRKTIVFISHDLAAVERLCDRVLVMSHGEIVREGKPRDVIPEYQKSSVVSSDAPPSAGKVSRVVKCIGFSHGSRDGQNPEFVRTGEPMTMTVYYEASRPMQGLMVSVYLYWPTGYLCTQISTDLEGFDVDEGAGCIEFECPVVNLRQGLYLIDVAIERPPEVIDRRHRCAYLRVDPGEQPSIGDLYMAHTWTHSELKSREPNLVAARFGPSAS